MKYLLQNVNMTKLVGLSIRNYSDPIFSRHGHIQASKAILFWDDSLFDLQQTNLIGQ